MSGNFNGKPYFGNLRKREKYADFRCSPGSLRICVSGAIVIGICLLSACSNESAEALRAVQTESGTEPQLPVLRDSDLAAYIDPVAGFTSKVPVGWSRVQLSEPDHEAYAISFESPATHDHDIFADYLMVEFLSGANPQGFLADPAERTQIKIDGREAYRERLVLTDFAVGEDQLDLVVFQLTLLEIGYSFGLYVVGERREEQRLGEVFDAFVLSFEFPHNPLQVSLLE